jgi:hypothetical protein
MTKKEKLKKESNNSYFSYYHENLKFYFTGFCIALGLFIILFALWVISFNSTPQLLNNPKTLYYLKDNAFWEISTWEIEINQTNKIKNTIIAAYPILYHIGENQIPSLSKSYYIIREWESKNVSINPLIKYLRLPEIKTKAFDSWKVENILFKTATWKYYISIDLNHNKIEIFNANEEYVEQEKEFTDKEIIKYIKTELNNLWLSLKYYSDPITIEDNKSIMTLFYPKNINWIEIRNSENEQEWLSITFDKEKWIITDIFNYDTETYQLSKYTLTKTKKDILETLRNQWNIDTSKKWEEWSIPMEKWKFIYLNKGNLIVPALLFESNSNIEKKIILPMF